MVAIVGLVAAFLTALYMFRLVFLTFFGKPRFDTAHVHPHESPATMTLPLVLLAIPSAVIGFVGFPPDDGRFHHFLEPVFAGHEEAAPRATRSRRSTCSRRTRGARGTGRRRHEAAARPKAKTGRTRRKEHAHVISDRTKWTFGIISTIVALAGIFSPT